MIAIPIIAGIFLRVFQIWNNYYFSGELGRELLYVWQLTQNHQFLLTGLTTSHEWLTYGPIYYWILIPLTKIFGWSPFILFWLALAVSTVGILITYFVFREIAGKKFALILSTFISLSPLWIWATRLSKLHTFFFILMPLVIYFLYKVWQGKPRFMFWLGLTFGALFSFHYSQIPAFLVFILAFFIKRKNLKFKNYLMFALGLIIPNITIFIYSAQNKFTMLKDLVLWVPYRIAGFGGFTSQNHITLESIKGTLLSFNEFLGRNLFTDNRFWTLSTVLFLILITIFVVKKRKEYKKDFFTFYLITSTVVQFTALLIHSAPPVHYFFPVFLNFGLLFTYFTVESWDRRPTRIFNILIFTLMFAAGIFMYKTENGDREDYTPLYYQENAVGKMLNAASGQPFSIVRVGPYDYFPENYSQNYQFLILSRGGKLDPTSNLRFIIYDIGKVYVQKYEI